MLVVISGIPKVERLQFVFGFRDEHEAPEM